MAIALIIGTTAEAIKVAPIVRALLAEGSPCQLWNTAWHAEGLRATLEDLGLPQPDEHFIEPPRQADVARTSQVPAWMLRVLLHALRHRRRLRRVVRDGGGRPLVIVHGDTFTTVLGSLIGLLLGARVAHVEAGMRSGSLWDPLPEELNRRVVARLARLHFAPTAREADNLRRERARGKVVETGANTVVDALRMALTGGRTPVELPETFGLVTLHRFEMLRNGPVFQRTLEVLKASSVDVPLVMPVGEAERQRIEELALASLFDDRFRLIEKQPYARFLPLLARASFVVTDSGGLQEECAAIGKPCAVQRDRTERHQGLGENVVLTRLDMDRLRHFLAHWAQYRRSSKLEEFQPTRVILQTLRDEGHLVATTSSR